MRIKENLDPSKLYFTSDMHIHHSNILEFCKRPWGDVKTHDAALIQNWNRVVPKDGIVFQLGDLIMSSNLDYLQELMNQLNGTIYHILGNHCYRNRMDRESAVKILGGRVFDIIEIEFPDLNYRLLMSHYPFMYWRLDAYHLHGHVHSGPNSTAKEKVPEHPRRYDVGVDNNNYQPVSFFELTEIFLEKKAIACGITDYKRIQND